MWNVDPVCQSQPNITPCLPSVNRLQWRHAKGYSRLPGIRPRLRCGEGGHRRRCRCGVSEAGRMAAADRAGKGQWAREEGKGAVMSAWCRRVERPRAEVTREAVERYLDVRGG